MPNARNLLPLPGVSFLSENIETAFYGIGDATFGLISTRCYFA